MATTEWYDNPTVLRGFGSALTAAGVLETTEEYNAYFNFPQRYNAFYEAWEENDFPDPEHDNWDAFVEAVTDEDEEEEEEDGEQEG